VIVASAPYFGGVKVTYLREKYGQFRLPRVEGNGGFNGEALLTLERQPRLAGIKSNVIEAESLNLYLPRGAGIVE